MYTGPWKIYGRYRGNIGKIKKREYGTREHPPPTALGLPRRSALKERSGRSVVPSPQAASSPAAGRRIRVSGRRADGRTQDGTRSRWRRRGARAHGEAWCRPYPSQKVQWSPRAPSWRTDENSARMSAACLCGLRPLTGHGCIQITSLPVAIWRRGMYGPTDNALTGTTQPTAPIKVSWQATPVTFLHGWLLPSCDSKQLL